MKRQFAASLAIALLTGCVAAPGSASNPSSGANTPGSTGANTPGSSASQPAASDEGFKVTTGRKIGYRITNVANGETKTTSWLYEILSVSGDSAQVRYTTTDTDGKATTVEMPASISEGHIALPGMTGGLGDGSGSKENVTVPAGTFLCEKFQMSSPEGSFTVWSKGELLVKSETIKGSDRDAIELSTFQ